MAPPEEASILVIGGIGLDETTKIMPYDLSVNFTDTRHFYAEQYIPLPTERNKSGSSYLSREIRF